jgi:hypothetical protein
MLEKIDEYYIAQGHDIVRDRPSHGHGCKH